MNVMYKLQDSNYFAHPVDCELLLVQNDSKKHCPSGILPAARDAIGIDHTFLPTHSGMMIWDVVQWEYAFKKTVQCGRNINYMIYDDLGCCAIGENFQK